MIEAATWDEGRTEGTESATGGRESVARWMIEHGFATGHGDTLDDLLAELSWQVKEARDEGRQEAVRLQDLAKALAYADRADDNPSRWYSGEVTYLDYEDHARAVLVGLARHGRSSDPTEADNE